ncbi:MAG: 50S ribosomal protein L23 [Candidatus Omnitrophica bacterium]|nr:50S ribosomal protein L23 [Candidatus Omnitrophota bacterium]
MSKLMSELTWVIRAALQTEKGTRLAKANQYIFKVARDANKLQIKQAVGELFKVKVERVNAMMMPGKWRRLNRQRGQRPDWKKAIVTLADGQKIELK